MKEVIFEKLGGSFSLVIDFLIVTGFIWLPLVLIIFAFSMWYRYIRLSNIQRSGWALLELKLPSDIRKSPRAMEMFLGQLYQTGAAKNFIEAFWDGKIRPWFSLELVSLGGQVHFFIWCPQKFKNIIEAQVYAQYPSVEVYEVPDYTTSVVHDINKMTMWGTYFKLAEADAFPIKTYIDYGMDKDEGAEEEEKIDPITPVMEYLGSLRKGEQCWIQILIQAHRKEKTTDGRIIPKDDWKKDIEKELKKIRESMKEKVMTADGREIDAVRPSTKGESDTMEALDRSLDKWPFDCAIRGIYMAENKAFDASHITGLIGSVRQYSSNNRNGFKLGWFTDYDHPWRDFRRMRRNRIERQMLDAYKLRSFFQPPYKSFQQKPIILTTEELATIFHFPGGVATTPTFERVSSRKAEAPSNLPSIEESR